MGNQRLHNILHYLLYVRAGRDLGAARLVLALLPPSGQAAYDAVSDL